jgi:malic enzyme
LECRHNDARSTACITLADVLIALSAPGPDTVKREFERGMAPGSIVFCCANPIPETWPYAAKEEGAFIVANGVNVQFGEWV